jgi:hypothetical protein
MPWLLTMRMASRGVVFLLVYLSLLIASKV